ncbi:MAG TPA: TetR/AcrR family transcriptional regulator [Myxococcota bacterium]|jgi:AcrR family transcriptional regulator|nr:TetR/AcrR family transcriptional regulator [Myxococcota bacterium]
MKAEGPPRVDGRTLRGQRTRAALVNTVLAMVERGELRLTAPSIAAAAGVSIRSLFQHFPDLESLWVAAADKTIETTLPLLSPLPKEGPFEERLAAFLDQRCKVLELTTPIRRAASLLAPFSEEMRRRFENARRIGVEELERVFTPELARCPDALRARVFSAVEISSSWLTWESLRRVRGLSREESRAVLEHMLRAVLEPYV